MKVKLTPVWKEILVDLETPVSAFLKLKKIGAKVLLESMEKGETVGRYSFIGISPSSTLKIKEEEISVDDRKIYFQKQSFLEKFREVLFSFEVTPDSELTPFIGGWVGYLGYDVARFFESLPSQLATNLILPDGIFYLVREILVFDHLKHKAKIISLAESRENREKALERINYIIHVLNHPLNPQSKMKKPAKKELPQSNFSKGEFMKAVEKSKEYIRAGDILQVVLSQRFSGKTFSSPFQIYRALRTINPSPYMFFLDFEGFQLIGSSPEALAKLNGGIASVHPIAGTRPRGKTPEEDTQLQEELLSSEKEIAEHVMLVDLARNDLGKVCLPHSIKLKEKMKLEKYSHVMHLVSEVTGTLDPNFDALDFFRATFPAGTVTGAPKIRAMEIIEELDRVKRGPYAGAVGCFGLDGNMDMCIAIRMIIYQEGKYYLQAGAGIVADSIPSGEYRETLNKMKGLYQAIQLSMEMKDDIVNR
jgi:anthranilate synthase component 1